MPKAVQIQRRNEGSGGGAPVDVAALVRQFAPLVRRVARRYEGRGAEREDLEQEGYVALIVIARRYGVKEMARRLKRRLPGYVRDAAAKLWRPASLVSLSVDGEDGGPSLSDLLPDARAEDEVTAFELMDALERFLPREDLILARALADGMTQAEIAALTGESRATVGRRIARVRRRLCA